MRFSWRYLKEESPNIFRYRDFPAGIESSLQGKYQNLCVFEHPYAGATEKKHNNLKQKTSLAVVTYININKQTEGVFVSEFTPLCCRYCSILHVC